MFTTNTKNNAAHALFAWQLSWQLSTLVCLLGQSVCSSPSTKELHGLSLPMCILSVIIGYKRYRDMPKHLKSCFKWFVNNGWKEFYNTLPQSCFFSKRFNCEIRKQHSFGTCQISLRMKNHKTLDSKLPTWVLHAKSGHLATSWEEIQRITTVELIQLSTNWSIFGTPLLLHLSWSIKRMNWRNRNDWEWIWNKFN